MSKNIFTKLRKTYRKMAAAGFKDLQFRMQIATLMDLDKDGQPVYFPAGKGEEFRDYIQRFKDVDVDPGEFVRFSFIEEALLSVKFRSAEVNPTYPAFVTHRFTVQLGADDKLIFNENLADMTIRRYVLQEHPALQVMGGQEARQRRQPQPFGKRPAVGWDAQFKELGLSPDLQNELCNRHHAAFTDIRNKCGEYVWNEVALNNEFKTMLKDLGIIFTTHEPSGDLLTVTFPGFTPSQMERARSYSKSSQDVGVFFSSVLKEISKVAERFKAQKVNENNPVLLDQLNKLGVTNASCAHLVKRSKETMAEVWDQCVKRGAVSVLLYSGIGKFSDIREKLEELGVRLIFNEDRPESTTSLIGIDFILTEKQMAILSQENDSSRITHLVRYTLAEIKAVVMGAFTESETVVTTEEKGGGFHETDYRYYLPYLSGKAQLKVEIWRNFSLIKIAHALANVQLHQADVDSVVLRGIGSSPVSHFIQKFEIRIPKDVMDDAPITVFDFPAPRELVNSELLKRFEKASTPAEKARNEELVLGYFYMQFVEVQAELFGGIGYFIFDNLDIDDQIDVLTPHPANLKDRIPFLAVVGRRIKEMETDYVRQPWTQVRTANLANAGVVRDSETGQITVKLKSTNVLNLLDQKLKDASVPFDRFTFLLKFFEDLLPSVFGVAGTDS